MRPDGGDPLTLGVAFTGDPRAPTSWSGIPAGVVRGLEARGVTVRAIDVEVPRAVALPALTALGVARRARSFQARLMPEYDALQSVAARVAVRRAGHVDGIVQIGTEYLVATSAPVVTLEDMTVHQAVERYPFWRRVPPSLLERRLHRQQEAYRAAVACCTTSSWTARSVVEDYGMPADKVHVVGVGPNAASRPVTRDWSRPRYLFVGFDWKRKNGDAVVRAFAALHADVPDASLDVVGAHPPIDVPGVRGHGTLRLDRPAEQERLRELFEGATCFVMPSWNEPLGIVFVEAAGTGIPMIGTTRGGSEDVIRDAGHVVDPADDAALLAAMRSLADPATAARMGARASERATAFTWEAVGGRLLRALGLGDRATLPGYIDAP